MYLVVSENVLATVLPLILVLKMKFHHYQDNYYTYYWWKVKSIEDKVPEYATAVEGVGALILSPDRTEVLLVWEYGKWKLVTGAVKAGETILDTLFREVKEEVGIDLYENVLSVGKWHIAKSRFGLSMMNFTHSR